MSPYALAFQSVAAMTPIFTRGLSVEKRRFSIVRESEQHWANSRDYGLHAVSDAMRLTKLINRRMPPG